MLKQLIDDVPDFVKKYAIQQYLIHDDEWVPSVCIPNKTYLECVDIAVSLASQTDRPTAWRIVMPMRNLPLVQTIEEFSLPARYETCTGCRA